MKFEFPRKDADKLKVMEGGEMRFNYPLKSLMLCACALSSCRNADDFALLNEGETLSLNATSVAWSKTEIEVCFVNEPNDPKAKSIVQLALDRSFSKNSTYISYYGFKDCEPASKAPAKIRFGVPAAYSSHIGTTSVQIPNSLGETLGLPAFENEFRFYNTVLHIFGHFAGLYHTHAASESPTSSMCGSDSSAKGYLNENQIALKVGYSTTSDRQSIMNTCLDGFATKYLRLSDDDVRALRSLYAAAKTIEANKSQAQQNSEDQTAHIASNNDCKEFKIIPADIAKSVTRGYPTHTADGSAIYAYGNESLAASEEIGTLKVGTVVTKLGSQLLNKTEKTQAEENLTAMQVLPKSGPLQGKTVWIVGNVTVEFECQAKAE